MDVAVGERNGLVDEAGWWTKRVVTDVTDVSGRRGGVVYNSCQQLFGVSLFTTFIGLGQLRWEGGGKHTVGTSPQGSSAPSL